MGNERFGNKIGDRKAKQTVRALDVVVQWVEREPMNQSVAGSIPSQGPCLGCGPGPQLGGGGERQPHINVSLPVFPLPSPLSKNK